MATRDQDVTHSGDAGPGVLVREGSYGTQVFEVEPGGAEFIPLNERHGRPIQLFWTWTSPNMEFATIFVGMLAVAGFGLGFWEAALALVLGSAIGGVTQGILSMRGPKYGVPQMVLSRLGFGYWGNVLPAGLNSVTAGIGWFAVNRAAIAWWSGLGLFLSCALLEVVGAAAGTVASVDKAFNTNPTGGFTGLL